MGWTIPLNAIGFSFRFYHQRPEYLSKQFEANHWSLQRILDLFWLILISPLKCYSREKKLSSFLPAHVALGGGFLSTLRGRGGRHAEMEQNLIKEYRSVCSSSDDSSLEPTALLRQYLRTCHTLPYYGYDTSDQKIVRLFVKCINCLFFWTEVDPVRII